jgi:hypothetical protein
MSDQPQPQKCSDCVNFWKTTTCPAGRCTVPLPWWAEHALEPLTRKGDEEEFCECFEPKHRSTHDHTNTTH